MKMQRVFAPQVVPGFLCIHAIWGADVRAGGRAGADESGYSLLSSYLSIQIKYSWLMCHSCIRTGGKSGKSAKAGLCPGKVL